MHGANIAYWCHFVTTQSAAGARDSQVSIPINDRPPPTVYSCLALTRPAPTTVLHVARRAGKAHNDRMMRRDLVTRIIRRGDPPPVTPPVESSTPEARMAAVWELTLQCIAWRGGGEPRLQRSVVHVQRAPR